MLISNHEKMFDVSKESNRMKSKNFPTNPKIARREIITDQSDMRMIEFRKERGEFEPEYHQGNTVKLQITEYEAGPDEFQVQENIGFNDGAPSLFQIPIFREIAEKAILKVNEEYERERWGKELHISFRAYRRRDRKAVLEHLEDVSVDTAMGRTGKAYQSANKGIPRFISCWHYQR